MSQGYEVLNNVVRNSFAKVVWTHKIHEKQADIYIKYYKCMETINIVATALTSAGIVAIIFHNQLWLKLVSALISFATIFITIYLKSFHLHKEVNLHKAAANKLIIIRDQYEVLLLNIKLKTDTIENLILKYRDLLNNAHAVYSEAPITSEKAVKKASKALKVAGDNTFSNEDINMFLPEKLWESSHD